ncbi:MAG: TolC family protein, partial [Amphiplicatus sp.]
MLIGFALATGSGAGEAAPAGENPASLYPPSAEAVRQSPLGKALGPARYILDTIGQSEEFRAAVKRAVGLHPILHREISARAEARGHVAAERAALYPRLSASLSTDYVFARNFGPSTDNVVESLRPEAQLNAGLTVSQLLFDGGAAFQRIKGAKAHARAEALSIGARVNELSLRALSAYHDLAAHQAILKIGDEFIKRHEKLLNDVKERERLGAGTRADVMQATARLAAARARDSGIKESLQLADIR